MKRRVRNMFGKLYKNVYFESFGMDLPKQILSSAEIEDRLAPLYEKLKVPFGTLEKLSGVARRGIYTKDDTPSKIATIAAKQALENLSFPIEKLGAVFNCSVTRDYFEPATGVMVHRNLGLSENVLALDITNACIGFSNGIMMLANMIESGQLEAGLLVSGENLSYITDATFERLLDPSLEIDRTEFLHMLPTFTLGSGAVATVLCNKELATKGHRLAGYTSRSASQHSELCVGNGDFCFLQQHGLNPLMDTDSQKLIASAAKLGARSWEDTSKLLEWSTDNIDTIFCHQVGKQLGKVFYDTMGLPYEKEFAVYKEYGNLVSAALPSALITGINEGVLNQGDKVLLTAFGSGLNSIFTGIEW